MESEEFESKKHSSKKDEQKAFEKGKQLAQKVRKCLERQRQSDEKKKIDRIKDKERKRERK